MHPLTKQGEDAYHLFLEKTADDILFKHEHPVKWTWQKVKEALAVEK